MVERQELYCHNCDRYVQFNIDRELNGQHIIKCPNCGHEHYRYVNDGIISDRRWGSANQPSSATTYYASNATWTVRCSDATTTASSSWTAQLWANSTTAG